MGSLNKDSSVSASEIYNTANRIIGTSELAIRNTQVNQTIVAEGGRDFSWVWMIVLSFYCGQPQLSITLQESKILFL